MNILKKTKIIFMDQENAIHCWVKGRVQGVWFRAHTQEMAKTLGLKGWVKNCADGRVELMACGPQADLDELEKWLWKGSPLAKVEEVLVEKKPWQSFEDFLIL